MKEDGQTLRTLSSAPRIHHNKVHGESKTEQGFIYLKDYCEKNGLDFKLISERINGGMSQKEALDKPKSIQVKYLTIDNESKSLIEWAKQYGI